MTSAALVARTLAWFDLHARELPWRDAACTPWGVLVSEVMLQQTPVVRVEPRWRDWLTRWPTPAALAAAPTSEVLRAWGGLGYPRRALRLQECARVVVAEHDGVLPRDEEALRALPGIGAYTAAAVTAFAHGRRSVVLDTNVRRVLGRTLRAEALPAPHLTVAETRAADAVAPPDDARAARWAAASMELGALVCSARSPRCDACPVADLCAWRAAGYPADSHAARRRTQGWAGTDRQLRGATMRMLREAHAPVARADIEARLTALIGDSDPVRVDAVLAGLVTDGLAVAAGPGHLGLPA